MKLHDQETLNVAQAVKDVLEGKKPAAEGTHDYPHTMYHPESGEEKTAKNEEEHKALSAKGYTNEKNESPDEPVAKGEKDFKDKHAAKKSGAESDGKVVKEDADEEEVVVADPLPEIAPPGTAVDTELQEAKFSPALIKKAIAIATSPKFKDYYSGAYRAIEKLKKGLMDDPQVAAALKAANESVDEAQEFWTVTVLKSMNKLKKGQSVVVKGRNAAEALKKGAKSLGDPLVNQSGYLGAVKDVKEDIATEESEKQAKYKAFFMKALKKFGVKSPAELKGDDKSKFFDYVDKNYEADNEEDSEEEVKEAAE